ncbi:hypothetical protein SEA_YABOI_132 [Streptomyces phage Yaboi]|jgi:hypothetical protein|uniref:Uncharacterized protein n=3 Tax=Streptomyces virus Yaboi TaxID=2846408 RepID=A0A385UHE9_9CAUD|nr:hypothetical protein HWB86_gp161 [Streptomyces phage Yaboi]QAY08783.1 hypothetical protein SEA_GENIE2_133 [Streptomyces phage Genie2]QAY12773.1 hypothetical protein SEA_BOOMERJR_133 [Streptomyces phage BoomerJR]UVD39967.1 hypothetical protein SEA_STANIMAL_131 [Streptomyces phage Stanimal]WNM73709.1 hypothetical protein SEA_SOLLERTIA_132 [Streptomyces phage Sollertia]AYB70958.1 hypothetical protein SEA_YABOI_132 [Streptomyces phage Yaboi]
MNYTSRTYRFSGSNKLADEIAYLAVKNHLRVSTRTSTGLLRKNHMFVVFGDTDGLGRFESEMENAKRRIK